MKTKKTGKKTSPSARREPAQSGKGSGKTSAKASGKTEGRSGRSGGRGEKRATERGAKVKAKSKTKRAGASSSGGVKKTASTPRTKASLLPAADRTAPTRSPAKQKQLKEARVAAETAIEAALDKKALLPIVIDVSGQTTYTDFIGIVSGRSDRQVEAIAENVVMALKAVGFRLVGREGSGNGRWTLLDFGDVVIHVFYHPVREFYDIESLWIDAPRLKLKVPPEAMTVSDEALYYEGDPQRA